MEKSKTTMQAFNNQKIYHPITKRLHLQNWSWTLREHI